jgi:dolichol-phosphate mannosyltransferase
MVSDAVRLSIVCPAFNEENVLPLFHRELSAVLALLEDDYDVEVLYVDDGSRDRTLEVIKELAADDHRVRYLSFSRNFGQQAALTAGLEHAIGDVVITLDSDLQHPPALIPVLLKKWREGNEVVVTIRQEDPRLGLGKRLTSRLFYRLLRLCSDTVVRAGTADYRLLSRKAVNGLLRLREQHRFLRGLVPWLGFRTAEVVFQPARRPAGASKYTLSRMLALAGDGLVSFSRKPLRLALFLGLAAFVLGVVYAGYVAWRGLCTPQAVDGTTALLLLVALLFDGFTLCAVGLVGEYVGRIYDQVKGRPLYLLQESSDKRTEARAGRRKRPRRSKRGLRVTE